MKDKQTAVTKKTQKEHLHLRKSFYIGNCNTVKTEMWVVDDNMKLSFNEILYNEGYIKLINEIIDNSIDEHIKTNGKFSTKISVEISNDKTITVIDNGRGIPSSKDKETGKYQTELAFCDLNAGSNWDREGSIGMNGIGGSAVNMFSEVFTVMSADGKYTSILKCQNNADIIKFKREKGYSNGKGRGTTVSFKINDNHFEGIDAFSVQSINNIIMKRLILLNTTYKKITFKYNGKKLNNTIWDCISLSNPFEYKKDNIDIVVYHSANLRYDDISSVNGLDTYKGGIHLRHIKSKIANEIKLKINKKYKVNISNRDFYDKFLFGIMIRNFNKPEFNTQNKTELINSDSDINSFLKENKIDIAQISKKLFTAFENEFEEIVQLYKYKEVEKKSKNIKKDSTNVKRIENFTDAIDKNRKDTILFIVEGDSAKGHFPIVRNKKKHGMLPLKGKVLNAYNNSILKVLENKELTNLINIIGLKINTIQDTRYFDKIAILTDADVDGDHIATMLILFFYKYFPHIITNGRLIKVMSPIVICTKGKQIKRFYEYDEFLAEQKKYNSWTIKYNKGLGSLDEKEYSIMINDLKYETFTIDDIEKSHKIMNILFDKKNTDIRKDWLQGKNIMENLG